MDTESDNEKKKNSNKSKMPLLPPPSRKAKELSIMRGLRISIRIAFFCTLSTDHIKFQREEASMILFYKPFGKIRFLKQREFLKSFLSFFSQIHAFRELFLPLFQAQALI